MSRLLLILGTAIIVGLTAGVAWTWYQTVRGDERALAGVKSLFEPFVGAPDRRFALIDHTGRPVTDADFRGRLMLVYFGYSYCPDLCPTDLLAVAEAVERLGPAGEEVQPLFVTVDPERDTPEHLAGYVNLFHPRLIGLTGTREQVDRAIRNYGVVAQRRESAQVTDYLIDHSTEVYLLDRDGAFIRAFRYGTSPDAIAAAIRQHL